MRKSERIRELELKIVRLEMNLDMLTSVVQILLDQQGNQINLESGKWYTKQADK